ncbi:BTAD domain-containing putative transcriptional regulator [Pseudonocardia acaciae]|uniref:BTAD domain-containing putative transcriptional regulator n=1 Tax=Pseudonocardia acaciae TaxID=551276 RepID=UPI00049009FA|nr:BTAD domain-containing putative transcriptional regulator [Pseudonocardia acaciae]
MRFGVLGPLAVWTDAGEPVVVPGALVRALLADLLVHRGNLVTADRLIDDLWGADAPRQPLGALQVKVSQLRRALDGAEPGARGLVVSRGPGYVLDVPAAAVDAGRFAELVSEAVTAAGRATERPAAVAKRLDEALALWRGPAFADVTDEEFAAPAIAELEELRLGAVEQHAEARLELGELDAVIGELSTLLDRHPLREKLHATRLRALYRAGRQAEALQRYDELRVRLRDELGLDPSPELVELHRAILAQEPTLHGGPPVSAATARTNLPEAWDETVGRERDVADLRALLGTARLVTLTGPGGVGKTRLAVETARLLVPTTPDGVRMVDLSGVDSARGDGVGELAELVAADLDLHDDASGDPLRRIVDAVADRHVLLLLDNCEQVVEPAAELVATLLRRTREPRVLATSREPLGLRGEIVRPVPALDLPADADDAEGSPAVRLFVARATATAPGFRLSRENAALVAGVCRQLDGLPLALELAAARVRTLGLAELAARLDDRFRVLGSGPRDAPARQRTLRAVMDWSWEPLSESERAVLRRLAVTADGCVAGLAERVCAGGPVEAGDVLELLSRLADRSLVLPVEAGGRTRYRLLETVSAYAIERLREAGEEEHVRYRHAVAATELAERASVRLRGPDQREWLDRLDAEAANLRAALDTAVARPDPALALRLVGALTWYWFLRGRQRTAARSLGAALEIAGATPSDMSAARADARAALASVTIRERGVADSAAHSRAALAEYAGLDTPGALAHARWLHAHVMSGIGALEECEPLAQAALATFRELGDAWGTAASARETGLYAMTRGRLDEARRAGEESARLFEELGDRWGQVMAAELLGTLDEIAGDHESAARRHSNALRWAEELQLWPAVIDHLSRLGRIAALTGDTALADEHHRRAMTLAREQGYQAKAVYAQLGLGMVARRTGRFDAAHEHLTAVHEWHRDVGYEPGKALTFAELGFLAEQRGDARTAARLHSEGLAAARRTGDPRAVALALEGLAGERALSGEHAHAARLLGTASAARASAGESHASTDRADRADVERITAAARAALGDTEFDAEFALGATLDADAVR